MQTYVHNIHTNLSNAKLYCFRPNNRMLNKIPILIISYGLERIYREAVVAYFKSQSMCYSRGKKLLSE
jgi:hypothetical protein